MLAFKSVSDTRWHISILVPEIIAAQESINTIPHQIEWQGIGQNYGESTGTTITVFADQEPTNIMGEHYKLKIEITEIISVNDWWYMSCKDCWLKVKKESDKDKCSTSLHVLIPYRTQEGRSWS